jgi:multidrug resistance efflux pump
MPRNSLLKLETIRKLTVGSTQRELGRCQQYEAAVAFHIRMNEQLADSNEPGKEDFEHRPELVNMLHQYAEKLRRRANVLTQHMPIAHKNTEDARLALANARVALKAVEELALQQKRQEQEKADRRAQNELEDVARGLMQARTALR